MPGLRRLVGFGKVMFTVQGFRVIGLRGGYGFPLLWGLTLRSSREIVEVLGVWV